MRHLTQMHQDERGFSLVELLVVGTLMLVVGGIVSTGAISGMRTTQMTSDRVEAQTELHKVVERVSGDLRAAELTPDGTYRVPFSEATPDRVTMQITRDGATTLKTYERSGTVVTVNGRLLMRNSGTSGPMFVFRDRSGAEIDNAGAALTDAQRADIASVTLIVERLTSTDPADALQVATTVALRNVEQSQ